MSPNSRQSSYGSGSNSLDHTPSRRIQHSENMMVSSNVELETRPHSDELSQGSKPLDTEKTNEDARDLKPVEPLNESTSEYPHGMRLAIIMVSLMLSVFLVALDNVSDWPSMKVIKLTLPSQDYSCHGNSKNYRRVPWPRQGSMV